jgi:uncharacterized protein YbcI
MASIPPAWFFVVPLPLARSSDQRADQEVGMGRTSGASPAEEEHAESMLLNISNEMVRIYKEMFGRGPTKTRTDWAGPDALLCTLRETFTPAERSLVALGEHQRLRDIRLFFQHAAKNNFVEAVERITGRKVSAFVSGVDTTQDVASELFYLEPRE